jgi:hypothetical protein
MLLPRFVLSEYSTQIVDMRVKEATTNDRSLTSASQRRGRFITGRSSLCLHLVRPSSDWPLAPNTWAAEILDGEMQPRRDLGGVRHRSVDTLRGYVRDAELFKDHAFGHPAARRWGPHHKLESRPNLPFNGSSNGL